MIRSTDELAAELAGMPEGLERERLTAQYGDAAAHEGERYLESRKSKPGLLTVCVADVEAEVVRWLWRYRIPLGKVTLVDGDPGLGKSTLTLEIAACVSNGRGLPEQAETLPSPVIILSAEDGVADTIRPRLEAAGADLALCHVVTATLCTDGAERLPEIGEDLVAIEQKATEIGAKLIVIDPFMAYLGGGVDAHKDQDIRRAMAPLAAIAERTECAILIVRHLNKGSGRPAIYRGGGSIGIAGAARSVLVVAEDPEDGTARVLAPVKSNLGPAAEAIRFRLVSVGDVAKVAWEGVSTHSAEALLATRGDPEERSAIDTAVEFLRDSLCGGPTASADVVKEAKAAGISERTLDRAKYKLGVKSKKDGFSGKWRWTLPDPIPKDAKATTEGGAADFGTRSGTEAKGDKGTAEECQDRQTASVPIPLEALTEGTHECVCGRLFVCPGAGCLCPSCNRPPIGGHREAKADGEVSNALQ